MKSATKHIVISTVLCALTLVVFLAFYNRLPESIPIHFDSAGVANSFWPRNVVVFGVPVACVLLNLISGFTVSQKENAKPYMYYIMAVVAFVATGIKNYRTLFIHCKKVQSNDTEMDIVSSLRL